MTKTSKPPYSVPTMDQISRIPKHGFKVCSTFSGCGGSSLGYKMAGFDVLWANEFIDEAARTYELNHLDTILDRRDIRKVTAQDILEATGLAPGELDLFDGSPPCSSFSTAGKREKLWGKVKKYSDKEQRTDDLFFEYVRLLEGLQPKVFVAENVKGLTIGTAKEMMGDPQTSMFGGHAFADADGKEKVATKDEDTIYHALCDAGYLVRWEVLNAAQLGVPQARQRTIFVGVRKDLGLSPAFPRPQVWDYSIRDAVPWIDRPWVFDDPRSPKPEPETDISRYAVGREWDKLGGFGQSEKFFQLVRPHPDKPCPTITASGGSGSLASVCHPFERRKFSIAELKRLCGFPDDFRLTGSYQQQYERLGRAVPPVMMAAIAKAVRDEVLHKIPVLT